MSYPPGSSFQFTPYGLRPLGDASGGQPGEFAPSAEPALSVPRPAPSDDDDDDEYDGEPDVRPVARAMARVAPELAKVAKYAAALKPRDVLKLARGRIREIKAELRCHAKLKIELKQLENMLSAAKPLASVRALDSARRSAG